MMTTRRLVAPANLLRKAPEPGIEAPAAEQQQPEPGIEAPAQPEPVNNPKKKRQAAPPASLAALGNSPESLDVYNLDALKKIAKMAGSTLPKPCTRASCLEMLTKELFGKEAPAATAAANECGRSTSEEEDDDDVHTVNLSSRQSSGVPMGLAAAAW